MPFYHIFEEIFFTLQAQHNNIVVMAAFIVLHLIVAVLRLTVFLGYRGHNMWMTAAKEITSLSEVSSIRSGLLRRIAGDYIAVAEKNAPRVPLSAIIDKHVSDLSLAGWRYNGITLWTQGLESGLIFLGIILALIFPQYGVVYGILAVTGFLLLRLAAAFFDYDTARQLLIADIHLYVEREIGHFFAGHVASAMSRFKEDVSEAIDRQSVLLRGAVEKLSSDLIPALSYLGRLENLPKAIENMQQSNERYALHHEAFISQTQIIKDAQTSLESSLSSYETTLQNIVQTMGSGLGTFIQMHGQTAAAGLTEHITRMSEINRDTIDAITVLIEQLTAGNRDISTQLRALHERIEDK